MKLRRRMPPPTYGMKVRTWMASLVLTVLVVTAMLTIVPLGDMSYRCQRSPISLVREPAVETGGEQFFDEGAACNADARRRLAIASAIAVAGTLVAVGVALAPRLGMRERPLRVFTGLLPLLFAIGLVLVVLSPVANTLP